MRSTLLILALILCGAAATAQKSFEGVITYTVKLGFKKTFPKEYQLPFRQRYGDTLLIYFSAKGDQYRHYPNSSKKEGIDYQLYKRDSAANYAKYKYNDTLWYFYTDTNSLRSYVWKDPGPSAKIFGQDCQSIIAEGIHHKMKTHVRMIYFYSGKPYLDPEHYANFRDFFTNKIVAKAQSPFLKFQIDQGGFFIIYEAVKIEKKKLDPTLFQIPTNAALGLLE